MLLNIGVVSNETNTDVHMYNLILLDDLHYSMYKVGTEILKEFTLAFYTIATKDENN